MWKILSVKGFDNFGPRILHLQTEQLGKNWNRHISWTMKAATKMSTPPERAAQKWHNASSSYSKICVLGAWDRWKWALGRRKLSLGRRKLHFWTLRMSKVHFFIIILLHVEGKHSPNSAKASPVCSLLIVFSIETVTTFNFRRPKANFRRPKAPKGLFTLPREG